MILLAAAVGFFGVGTIMIRFNRQMAESNAPWQRFMARLHLPAVTDVDTMAASTRFGGWMAIVSSVLFLAAGLWDVLA